MVIDEMLCEHAYIAYIFFDILFFLYTFEHISLLLDCAGSSSVKEQVLMAAAALKLGEQKGEKMGLPCEKNTDNQPGQINQESKGATQDSEPQKMESEMQMSGKRVISVFNVCFISS